MAGKNISSEGGKAIQSCKNSSGWVPPVEVRGQLDAKVHNGMTKVPICLPCSICFSTDGIKYRVVVVLS